MALPDRPRSTIVETPDIAVAKTIGKLTNKDVTIEMLGNLDNDNDIGRLSLFIHLGTDKDIDMTWIKDYAYTELALTNSLRTKAGGIRSEHLVRITKTPDMLPINQNEGIISRLRGKFSR